MKDLTPEQFGQKIGHRKKFVLRCIRAGWINARDESGPGCKLPRFKIPETEVERWKQGRAVKPVAEPEPLTPIKTRPAKATSPVSGLLDRKRAAKRTKRVPQHA